MRVDLEDLAEGYAHRPASEAGLDRARRAAISVSLGEGDVGVDIGGGRGRHAAVWREFGAQAIVVDPARGMATEAATIQGVEVIRAAAQKLPLRSDCARLAYFHLSIHYGDWMRRSGFCGREGSAGYGRWVRNIIGSRSWLDGFPLWVKSTRLVSRTRWR